MKAIYFLLFCVLSLYAAGQNSPRLVYEAPMRKSDHPISEIIYKVPASANLKIISHEGGYYKVEYRGQIGYINEMFFEKKSASGTGSSSSTTGRSSNNNQRWNEQRLKSHWTNTSIDQIEGIYEAVGRANSLSRYKLGFLKTTNGYNLIYLSGAPRENAQSWSVGDIKATLTPTATPNLFRPRWYMADKTISENLYIVVDQGYFKVIWSDSRVEEMYIKLYPAASDQRNRAQSSSGNEPRTGSGTGFAISTTGHIVTNLHVIDGANKIKIRGINNNFSITYNARVLLSDRNNDLALLQIDDPRFSSFPPIPFQIKENLAEVGENVFVLGYPLRRSMGDEIKLTNGIISSRSGFQGDITSYQISAPAQPGNSGGPLFDSRGLLIGVISAKHSAAENVTYAVKVSYLKSLIGSLSNPPSFSRTNQLNDLPLTQQVEILKKFVFIIETE